MINRARLAFAMNAPALRSAAAPVVPAWTPTDLGAALKFWATAADHGTARMTDDGAGLISSITDKVSAITLTATTTARPTWAATSFNSAYPGLTADAVANCFTTTSFAALPQGSTPGWMFAVFSNAEPSAATVGTIARYGSGAASGDRYLARSLSTVSRLRISDSSVNLGDTTLVLDGPHFAIGDWNGTTMGGRIDGRPTTPATATIASLATGAVRFRIFSGNAAVSNLFKGVLADLMMGTTITLGQYQQLEGWAAWKYGLTANLPAGHPYKSAAP